MLPKPNKEMLKSVIGFSDIIFIFTPVEGPLTIDG